MDVLNLEIFVFWFFTIIQCLYFGSRGAPPPTTGAEKLENSKNDTSRNFGIS